METSQKLEIVKQIIEANQKKDDSRIYDFTYQFRNVYVSLEMQVKDSTNS